MFVIVFVGFCLGNPGCPFSFEICSLTSSLISSCNAPLQDPLFYEHALVYAESYSNCSQGN